MVSRSGMCESKFSLSCFSRIFLITNILRKSYANSSCFVLEVCIGVFWNLCHGTHEHRRILKSPKDLFVIIPHSLRNRLYIFRILMLKCNIFLFYFSPSHPTVHTHTPRPISPWRAHCRLSLWSKRSPPASYCMDAWGQSITAWPPLFGVIWHTPHHKGRSSRWGRVRVPSSQSCGDRAHRCAAQHPAERCVKSNM